MHAGVDLSLTRSALLDLDSSGVVAHRTLVATKPGEFGCTSARLDYIVEKFEFFLTVACPALVAVEGFSFASKGMGAVESHGLGIMVRHRLWDFKVPYIDVPPSTLKKFVTGSGTAEKNLMLREVYKRWGYDAANDDEADAFALAQFALAYRSDKQTKKFQALVKKIAVVG